MKKKEKLVKTKREKTIQCWFILKLALCPFIHVSNWAVCALFLSAVTNGEYEDAVIGWSFALACGLTAACIHRFIYDYKTAMSKERKPSIDVVRHKIFSEQPLPKPEKGCIYYIVPTAKYSQIDYNEWNW